MSISKYKVLILGGILIFAIILSTPYVKAWIKGYRFSINSNTKEVYITSYKSTKKTFVAPDHIGAWKVSGMAFSALQDNDYITNITKPANVSYQLYLRDSMALKTVVYEQGTMVINDDFGGCKRLMDVTLPEGLEIIKGFAFDNCESLNDISIPSSVTFVGANAFNNTAFQKNHRSDEYYVVGSNVLLFYNGDTETIIIPNGVRQVAAYTLMNYDQQSNVKEIYIPDSVESFGEVIPEGTIAYFGDEEITDLFTEYIKGLVVAPKGSYMEKYCEEHKLNFREMTEEEHAEWEKNTKSVVDRVTYG